MEPASVALAAIAAGTASEPPGLALTKNGFVNLESKVACDSPGLASSFPIDFDGEKPRVVWLPAGVATALPPLAAIPNASMAEDLELPGLALTKVDATTNSGSGVTGPANARPGVFSRNFAADAAGTVTLPAGVLASVTVPLVRSSRSEEPYALPAAVIRLPEPATTAEDLATVPAGTMTLRGLNAPALAEAATGMEPEPKIIVFPVELPIEASKGAVGAVAGTILELELADKC